MWGELIKALSFVFWWPWMVHPLFKILFMPLVFCILLRVQWKNPWLLKSNLPQLSCNSWLSLQLVREVALSLLSADQTRCSQSWNFPKRNQLEWGGGGCSAESKFGLFSKGQWDLMLSCCQPKGNITRLDHACLAYTQFHKYVKQQQMCQATV